MPLTLHRKQLTDFQKGEIVALSAAKNPSNIGHELNVPRKTVDNFLRRYQKRGSMENLPWPGRPRSTSVTGDRWLARVAMTETRLPLQELKSICNIPISTRTIQRRLKERDIGKWRAVNRALLTEAHAQTHLKWAREHKEWTTKDWSKVIWSDESAIKKDSDARTVWVWRHQNKREKYLPKNVEGKKRNEGISQMIWGCFADNKLGPIVFVDDRITQDVYMGVLQHGGIYQSAKG